MTTIHRVADRLKTLMDARRIPITQLSELTGIADKTLRRRIQNPTQYTFDEFGRLSHALGVDPVDLLNLDVDINDVIARTRSAA